MQGPQDRFDKLSLTENNGAVKREKLEITMCVKCFYITYIATAILSYFLSVIIEFLFNHPLVKLNSVKYYIFTSVAV